MTYKDKGSYGSSPPCIRRSVCAWRRKRIECLIFIGHFPQKSPIFSGSFAKRDLQCMVSSASSPPCTKGTRILHAQQSRVHWWVFSFFTYRYWCIFGIWDSVRDIRTRKCALGFMVCTARSKNGIFIGVVWCCVVFCGAVWGRVVQGGAGWCCVTLGAAAWCSVVQCRAMRWNCCSVLQYGAVWCSVVQCINLTCCEMQCVVCVKYVNESHHAYKQWHTWLTQHILSMCAIIYVTRSNATCVTQSSDSDICDSLSICDSLKWLTQHIYYLCVSSYMWLAHVTNVTH